MCIQGIYKKILFGCLILALLEGVSAKNITIEYNEEANCNEEFSIEIGLVDFPNDVYDVKIDILAGEKRISKILNNNVWKSTNYYVPDCIKNDEKREFALKISEEYDGEADILVKIRNSKNSVTSFADYKIRVGCEKVQNKEEEERSNEKEEDEISIHNEETAEMSNKKEEIIEIAPEIEVISLEKGIKTWKSKKRYIKEYSVLGFALFLMIALMVLMIYKKRKIKNE